MENKHHILLCVAGATPQIITETLYHLTVVEGKRVDEIRVITTLEGRDKIVTGIIKSSGGSAAESLLDPNEGNFHRFLRHYPQPNRILFDESRISLIQTKDGQTLEDIRTPEQNALAGDQICGIVRELCADKDNVIFASAAGGRKTMSIYLTLAMSLFGRSFDSLSHVLVSEDFETNRKFFYPPPDPVEIECFNPRTKEKKMVSTAEAEIYLAPIPFIRLRGVGSETEKFGRARTYGEMVEIAQTVLDIREKEYEMIVEAESQTINVRGQRIKLSPREFFYYWIFARRRTRGEKATSLATLTAEEFGGAFEHIFERREGEKLRWSEVSRAEEYRFAVSMLAQLQSGREDDFRDFRGAFSKVVTLIARKLRNNGVDKRYHLVTTDDGTASYKLGIAPEKITLK